MDKFIESYGYIAFLLVFIFEYLVANAKIKENSTIELIISVVKFIFGLNKDKK